MKQLVLLALSFSFSVAAAQAQRTEFSLHATSGYFSYRGASSASTSAVALSDVSSEPDYLFSPYGRRFTLSYGGAGQIQRVTAHQLVLGAQAGYEWLRSRVEVNEIYYFRGQTPASGHAILTSEFINTHLFIGHRFSLNQVSLDATLGPEVGFRRSIREKGSASGGGLTTRTDRERRQPAEVDPRVRVNLTAYYQRVGLSVGYTYGLLDYKRGYAGGTNDLFSQMLRVGAVYRLN